MKRNNNQQASTSTKRKRNATLKIPTSFYENESIELVSSPLGPIQTIPVSNSDREILLDRFKTEIINRFHFQLSRQSKTTRKKTYHVFTAVKDCQGKKLSKDEIIEKDKDVVVDTVQSRIIIGINQCTRTIMMDSKESGLVPSLVILARDLYPPTIISHIPYLCKQRKIPILLIPGNTSDDLGKMLGAKTASIILFLERNQQNITETAVAQKQCETCHKGIDSFIKFAKSKVPHK